MERGGSLLGLLVILFLAWLMSENHRRMNFRLIASVNWFLSLSSSAGGPELSLERLLGWVCAPLAWLLGVEWKDAETIGMILGKKIVLNEFLAYQDVVHLHDRNNRWNVDADVGMRYVAGGSGQRAVGSRQYPVGDGSSTALAHFPQSTAHCPLLTAHCNHA